MTNTTVPTVRFKGGEGTAIPALLATLAVLSLSCVTLLGGFPLLSAGLPSGVSTLRLAASSSIPNYPTYLGDVERDSELKLPQRSINVSNAVNLRALWTFGTNDTIASQAIVNTGVVFVGSWNGFEYTLNASTGALLWKTYLGVVTADTGPGKCISRGITSTPTYYNHVLYVYAANSSLDALNPATGAVLWSASPVPAPAFAYYGWSSPLIYDGAAYVGLASQCDLPLVAAGLAEISLASHKVIHSFNSSVPYPNGSSVWSSPSLSVSTNTIYITTGNPYEALDSTYGEAVVSLNATTLTPKSEWKVPLSEREGDTDFGATPIL